MHLLATSSRHSRAGLARGPRPPDLAGQDLGELLAAHELLLLHLAPLRRAEAPGPGHEPTQQVPDGPVGDGEAVAGVERRVVDESLAQGSFSGTGGPCSEGGGNAILIRSGLSKGASIDGINIDTDNM